MALISLIANFYFLQNKQEDNRVVAVADGDTFQLQSGQRVRLMGVDAPELERCGGPEAKARLSHLLLNKTVTLKESVKENFGRTMSLVYVDGQLINKTLMAEGWGRPDYKKNSQRDALTAAYHQAQDKKAGLWSLCINPNPPNDPHFPNRPCLIKGNIDTATYEKFYHQESCRHYAQIVLNTAYGDQWFCSEEEAQKSGFKKSASCNQ